MGSSMVITWALRVEFTWSTIQASVVVLPLPAGPVKRPSPLGQEAKAITLSGMPRAVRSGRVKETTPHHRPQAAPLLEGVDPKTGQAGQRKGEVVVPGLEQKGHIPLPRQAVEPLQQSGGVRRAQALPLRRMTPLIL